MKIRRSALRTGALLGAMLLGLFVALSLAMPAVAFAHGDQPPPEPKCYGECPQDQVFEASGLVCPAGYDYHNQSGPLDCRKWVGNWWNGHYVYAERITETFSVTFDYAPKPGDENKCRRPSIDTLNVPEWAEDDFIDQYPRDIARPEVPCYETCDETVALEPVITYGEWSDWTFDPDTGLMERSRTKTTTTVFVDARDGKTPCGDPEVVEEQQEETRDPEQRFFAEATCEGWQVFQTGEGIDGDELIDAGVWENPLVDESFFHEEYDLQIDEPQDCFEIGDDVSFEADCDAWKVFALTLVDGEVVASELIDQGEWGNPYRQERVVVLFDEQEITFYEPVECVQCKRVAIGELFLLIGPNGEQGWLASYQRNPNTGDWAIPNVGAQQQCLGFVAVAAPEGKTIYRDCNGEINLVCYRCTGGGDGIPGAYKGR